MKIDREAFLNDLLVVKAGLSPREYVEQSSCFVFENGEVMTFNDEVACIKKTGLPKTIKGAVQAQILLDMLGKLTDEILEVSATDEELIFKGNRDRFGIAMQPDILLPISTVEVPDKWRALPKEFTQAVDTVRDCVSHDETQFILTCIHITPDYLESCDNLSLMRCTIDTGFDEDIMVKGTALASIAQLSMEKVSVTKAWLHFKQSGENGMIFSCRRYEGEYHNLDPLLDFKGARFVIPKDLREAAERAAVAAVDNTDDPKMWVHLEKDRMKLQAKGLLTWYQGMRKVVYDGPQVEFYIHPNLLKMIAEEYKEAEVTDSRLRASGANWEYVTSMAPPENSEPAK